MIFGYDQGQLALLSCAVRASTPQEVRIIGTDGYIAMPPSFWKGTSATLVSGGKSEMVDLPYEGNGYNCEASEVQRCVREGKLESGTIPLDETLAIMGTLDRIRAQWGLKYPME